MQTDSFEYHSPVANTLVSPCLRMVTGIPNAASMFWVDKDAVGVPQERILPLHSSTASSTNNGAISNPPPEYPVEARRLHQEGVALLGVEVSAEGRPTSVHIKRSSGVPVLDQAALDAVRRWTFEPARIGGLPVASSVDVPLRFSLAR